MDRISRIAGTARALAVFMVSLLLVLSAGCRAENAYPWLDELDAGDGAKASGARLMALDYGLHPLDRSVAGATTILIGVHGFRSEGYEWVYPLKTLDADDVATYFFRWDYSGCSGPAADALWQALEGLLATSAGVQQVRVIGHSYGGVLVSQLVARDSPVPIEIHTVAAPLAGMGGAMQRCGYTPPQTIGKEVQFFQWRTLQHLDSAFKDLDKDPQVLDLPEATITRLPETYRGNRLGHNWSISWVADELKKLD